ncbi:MAG: hypothetical protein Q4G27_00245 [Flavobacteriaceae bacterium]|nr:hypothetical protein [Flavobacteriaceae bacterium]
MNDIFEILKYLLPMLVLGGIFYMLIEKFFAEETARRRLELQLKDREILTPQKLQAYERMALFLERIRPTNLVRRVALPDSADAYEYSLVNAIQEEFDYNLSQQLYVDPETWKIIFSAKNTTQNFVRQCRQSISNPDDVSAFQAEIIRKSLDGAAATDAAMLKLQSDVHAQF